MRTAGLQKGKAFQNFTVRVVSERIDTHLYESTVLAKAFQEITGMKVIYTKLPGRRCCQKNSNPNANRHQSL